MATMRLGVFCGLLLAAGLAAGQDQSEAATALIERIKGVKEPAIDRSQMGDSAYLAKFQEDMRRAVRLRSDLIADLYRKHPNHAEIGPLLDYRWGSAERLIEKPEEREAAFRGVLSEIETVLTAPPKDRGTAEVDWSDWPPVSVREPAFYWRAYYRMRLAPGSFASQLKEVEAFSNLALQSMERSISLYGLVAFEAQNEQDTATALRAMLTRWKDRPGLESFQGVLNRIEAKGKSLNFQFTDVTTGKTVSLKDYAGKVVLIEFFSPKLSTSVARLPLLRMLERELGPKGLAIIGVAMDSDDVQGSLGEGRPTLKGADFVKSWVTENRISWPVQFTGSAGQTSWLNNYGIMGIPTVLVVDRKGILRLTSLPSSLKGELEALLAEP
jgi:thiol-disulfide isomerase/thioredoxin